MADTKPFADLSDAELRKQLDKFVSDTGKTGAPALATFAKFQEQRAARLNQGLKQIKKSGGEDHPDYAATKAAAEAASAMHTQFLSHAARIKSRPAPRANEWVVFGQVLDASGNPAAGLIVQVLDRDRKYDDLLGEAETDANGDFSVTYHERDFKETHENLPELYVLVLDGKGRELFSSRDDVRFNAGRSEYFLIRLGQTSPRKSGKKRAAGK
jgi:hypothetical protein